MTGPVAPRRGHALHGWLSALLAAGFLWWFLRDLDLGAVADRIRMVRPAYFAAAVAFSLAGFIVRSLRWRYLLASLKWVRLSSAVSAVFIGWAVTAILPGRLGEIARAVILARREDLRSSAVLGTIVVARLVDALVVVLFALAYLAFEPAGTPGRQHEFLVPALRTGALLALGGLTGVALAFAAAHRWSDTAHAKLRAWMSKLPGGRRASSILEGFGGGLSTTLRDTPQGVAAARIRLGLLFHTMLLWTLICGVHVSLLIAFGIEPSFLRIAPLIFLITLGISVPTPAALGSYHRAVQFALTAVMGVPSETAAGYAILSHTVTFVPSLVIGVVLLAREGLALSSIVRTDA